MQARTHASTQHKENEDENETLRIRWHTLCVCESTQYRSKSLADLFKLIDIICTWKLFSIHLALSRSLSLCVRVCVCVSACTFLVAVIFDAVVVWRSPMCTLKRRNQLFETRIKLR